eukprot:CAMPEP_0167746356 /NCGR_PEP_ID=MMETSP0110_2-20121227/3668_1 /TAXON_ID=629695 /ORGANISM="Gymnochlora sp., Strain CCMP2014" /LENGTH=308 /DNA_ID=CAMNT_0007631113 /DNA_START=87 /DNA_END=1014 /DNA_ORIENTATION=-
MHALIARKNQTGLDEKKETKETLINFFVKHWLEEYHRSKKHFLRTKLYGMFGIGRQGHGSIARYYYGLKSLKTIQNAQNGRENPGNAPPMRSIPFAFISDEKDERLKLCIVNSDTTHPHPKARLASYLIATALSYLISNPSDQSSIIKHCIKVAKTLKSRAKEAYDPETIRYLMSVDELKDYHSFGARLETLPLQVLCGPLPNKYLQFGNGYSEFSSMHTLGVVLYLLKYCKGAMDGLKHSMWIGGDVDSIGALVLGIIGMWKGIEFHEDAQKGGKDDQRLPMWMINQLEAVEYMIDLADKFAEGMNV